MVPTLYFCRLEAYARNAHCSRAGPFSQGYTMALPNPDTYQDLNSDYSFIERNHHLFVKKSTRALNQRRKTCILIYKIPQDN